MASTTYVDFTAPAVNAEWLNDINDRNYDDVVNVKNAPYNATGDGSTDDTAAIIAAFAAAEAIAAAAPGVSGACVYFPSGEYKVTSGISVTEDNITILGDGGRVSTIMTPNSIDVFTFTGSVGLTIEKLGIRANTAANLSSGSFIVLNNVSNGRFVDLDLRGWYNAFSIIGTTRSHWESVFCSQIGRTAGIGNHAFNLTGTAGYGGCSGNHFTDCEIWNSSSVVDPAYSCAFRTTSSDGLYITQCHATGGDYDLFISPTGLTSNDTMASVLVTNSYFDTCGTNNLVISGTASAFRDIQFANCVFRAAGAQNVVVTPAAGSTLIGFQFINNQVRSAATTGMTIGDDTAEAIVIVGNVFSDNNTTADASGRDLILRGTNLVVTNNVFQGGNATGEALLVASEASEFIIKDNDFTGSTRTTKILNQAAATNGYVFGPNKTTTLMATLIETATVQTTNATPTQIWTFDMPQESACAIHAEIFALTNTISSGTYVQKAASFYRNGAAAAAQIGSTTTIAEQETSGSYDTAISLSSNTIQVVITGLVGSTVDWLVNVKATIRQP